MTKEIEFTIPIKTISEANSPLNWRKKHQLHKQQKKSLFLNINKYQKYLKTPCKITMTRLSPRQLDKHDNLPCSMKYIVDALCAIITHDFTPGRADDNPNIQIQYDQEKNKEYMVKIKIEFL